MFGNHYDFRYIRFDTGVAFLLEISDLYFQRNLSNDCSLAKNTILTGREKKTKTKLAGTRQNYFQIGRTYKIVLFNIINVTLTRQILSYDSFLLTSTRTLAERDDCRL